MRQGRGALQVATDNERLQGRALSMCISLQEQVPRWLPAVGQGGVRAHRLRGQRVEVRPGLHRQGQAMRVRQCIVYVLEVTIRNSKEENGLNSSHLRSSVIKY